MLVREVTGFERYRKLRAVANGIDKLGATLFFGGLIDFFVLIVGAATKNNALVAGLMIITLLGLMAAGLRLGLGSAQDLHDVCRDWPKRDMHEAFEKATADAEELRERLKGA